MWSDRVRLMMGIELCGMLHSAVNNLKDLSTMSMGPFNITKV